MYIACFAMIFDFLVGKKKKKGDMMNSDILTFVMWAEVGRLPTVTSFMTYEGGIKDLKRERERAKATSRR